MHDDGLAVLQRPPDTIQIDLSLLSFMTKQTISTSFDVLRSKNVEALKLLNRVIFPVSFPDSIYKECMATDLTQLAYHNDVLIGGIAVCLDKLPHGKTRVYIVSCGVLAPYRGYGVGTSLLNKLISQAGKDVSIEELQCHVQATNEEAVQFYERFGFIQGERVDGYYKKLPQEEQTAIIMSKKL